MELKEELQEAIDVLNEHIKIHLDWAQYFEAYPDMETQYVITGDWDDAKTQRKIADKYKKIVNLLTRLATERQ